MLSGMDLPAIERTRRLARAPAFIRSGATAHDPASDETSRFGRRDRGICRAIAGAIVSANPSRLLVIAAFIGPVFGITAGAAIIVPLIAAILSLAAARLSFAAEMFLSADKLPLQRGP